MTPRNLLRRHILERAVRLHPGCDRTPDGRPLATDRQVDAAWKRLESASPGTLVDIGEEVRPGEEHTGLPAAFVRNYDSKAVAAQMSDGTWVGWTWFHDGGKHSEPHGIPWMEDAVRLDCAEEEKVMIVRTFTKAKRRR